MKYRLRILSEKPETFNPLFILSLCRFVFLSLCLSIACHSPTVTVTEETFPDGSPKTVVVYQIKGDNREKFEEIFYYPGGKVRCEGEYRNGKKEGKWTFYYENCNKWSEGYFSNGVSDGAITAWYENGQKRYWGYFENGKQSGIWRFWDEKGNLQKEEKY